MYMLENDGASTDPWGRPFFDIHFRLTWFPRNTQKFRWLIRLAISPGVSSALDGLRGNAGICDAISVVA